MKKTVTKKADDSWKGYVNWSPAPSDRELVLEYMGRKDWSVHLDIEQLVECGYSVSFTYDHKSGCPRVSVTGKANPCPNIGYSLSIRASSVERCIGLVGYYCFVLCQSGDWLVEKSSEDVW